MAMKSRKDPLALLGQTLLHHPARLVELVIALWVPLTLFLVGQASGGDLERGEGLVGATLATFVLAGLGAIWWVLQGQAVELAKGPLWALPFLLFAGVQAHFLSDAPWRSVPFFGLLWMAWLVYAVVAQVIRQRGHLYLLTGLSLGVVFLLGQNAVNVDLVDAGPDAVERLGEASGRGGLFGVFANASQLVWCWLLTLPLAAVMVGLPRFPGYIRIALGGYLLFGLYLTATAGNEAAVGALVASALLLPWFVRPRARGRWKVFALVASLVVLAVGLYLLSRGLQDRVELARATQPTGLETARWTSAVEIWQRAPVSGVGLDAFPLAAESLHREPSGDDRWGARQSFLQLLAEGGLVGFALGLLALAGTWGRWWRTWLREPFQARDAEAEFRHSRGAEESEATSRRSRRRPRSLRLKRSTTRKVFLGGIVLGGFTVILFAAFDSLWQAAMPLLLTAILAGVAERLCLEDAGGLRLGGASRGVGLAMAALALVAAAFSLRFVDPYLARREFREAVQELRPYANNQRSPFEDPAGIYAAGSGVERVLARGPRNAEAWALRARVSLFEELTAREPVEKVAAEATEAARRAVELYPERGYHHFLLAEGLALGGAETTAVEASFARAVELAPGDLRIRFAWALHRFRDAGDREGSRELLEEILARDPEHVAARELMRRLSL
jgi:hypothetical protein